MLRPDPGCPHKRAVLGSQGRCWREKLASLVYAAKRGGNKRWMELTRTSCEPESVDGVQFFRACC